MATVRRLSLTYGSLPAGQHRSSAQVGVTRRLDAPDSAAMLTPRHSLSSLASLQLLTMQVEGTVVTQEARLWPP